MDLVLIFYAFTVALVAVVVRLPFFTFPMDEDFATWTYRAHFALKGLKWKNDMFCFYPTWRMHLLDAVYGQPGKGVFHIRLFLTTMHVVGSLAIFFFLESLSDNSDSAFLAAVLYAFFASAPAYSADSFNFEQIYVPIIILGLYWFSSGPNGILVSGFCFGIAILPKVSTAIFLPNMMALTAWQYGYIEMFTFTAAALVPLITSHIIEWKMGYLCTESKRQFNLRLAVTFRCSRLKKMYGSIRRDILLILNQTLPLWVIGPIGLFLFWERPESPLLFLYCGITFLMILCQRGFSRYHYFPMMAVWAISSVAAFDWVLNSEWENIALFFVFILVSWSAIQILPFYIKPVGIWQLAHYEKFDQLIYVPYLGKVLNRYFKMKSDTKGRLFVWGNYVQLYHMTGKPAADQYVHYAVGPWDDHILAMFFDTVIGGLLKHKPSLFIKVFHDFDMGLFKEITGLDYQLIKVVLGRFPVYRLSKIQEPSQNPLSLSSEEKLKLMEALTKGEHSPGISRLEEQRGRFHKAIAELGKLVKLNPWDQQGYFAMADIFERMGRTEEAVKVFENLIAHKPKHPNYRARLAKLMLDQRRLDEAKNLIEIELEKFGNTVTVRFHRGLLARIKGTIEEAEFHFQSVLKEDPDWHNCRLNLAELAQEKGAIEQARDIYQELWERAINFDWMRTKAVLGLAACDICLRSKLETLSMYHLRDSKNEPLAYALASELEQEGHKAEARKKFAQYTKQFQQQHLLASVWFRLGRLSEGVNRKSYLMNCLRLNPTHDGAYRMLEKPDVCRVKV